MLAVFGFTGVVEVLIIVFVVLLLFGNRLPTVARSIGKSIVEFRKGLKTPEDPDESKEELPG